MIRLTENGPQEIISEKEIEFLAGLYQDIQDKKQSFEQYLEEYKKEQVEEFLKSQK